MNWIAWWPWVAIALMPGALNLANALVELNQRCKLLPFFEPHKSAGFWLWASVQLIFPAVLFWSLASLSAQPDLSLKLLSQAAAFGAGFVVLLNGSTEIGSRPYSLKPLYAFFVRIAYGLIETSQVYRAAAFWDDLELALKDSPDLTAGLRFLENYFEVRQSVRSAAEKIDAAEAAKAQDWLTKCGQFPDRNQQAKAIRYLIQQQVQRRHLPGTLRRFQCNRVIQKYFPRSLRSQKRKRLRSPRP